MADLQLLGTRTFTMADQGRFAEASGDVNPMHMDPIAARRTPAGVPAVHGMHVLLWALDLLVAADPVLPIGGVAAKFQRFVAVDKPVELWSRSGPTSTRLEVRGGGARLFTITVRHTDGRPSAEPLPFPPSPRPDRPQDLDLAACLTACGAFPLAGGAALYPALAARLGEGRVAALAALSYLVGMVMPGLHSIFSALDIALTPQSGEAVLTYQVVHNLSGLLTLAVSAPGLAGEVQAILRPPPVAQPCTAELRARVAPDAFAGVSALVIGGSRGIGEVTAKLLAAGGARVAISHATGADDAKKVATDILAAGGTCDMLPLDVREAVAPQLAALPFAPDQVYYFATSKIFLPETELFAPAAFAGFQQIYVTAFAELCQTLSAAAASEVRVFYPSSVAVADRPRAMTEYAMAKAAGEILCADVDRFLPRVRTLVRRLPRLMTDQTATIAAEPAPPPTEIMLEVIRAMMDLA